MFPKTFAVFDLHDKKELEHLTEEALAEGAFKPLTGGLTFSGGWVPVRDEQLLYTSRGHSMLKFMVEKKSVPLSAVNVLAAEKAAAYAEATGFPPGKKAWRELKEQARDELTPRAIPTRTTYTVLIDHNAGRLLLSNTSAPIITAVSSRLYRDTTIMLDTLERWPGRETMTGWLADYDSQDDYALTVDDTVEMEFPGENGKMLRYQRANLSAQDVLRNLGLGAKVTALAVTWDNQVSFTLGGDKGCVSKVKALEITKVDDKDPDSWDNTFWLVTETLHKMINNLTEEKA